MLDKIIKIKLLRLIALPIIGALLILYIILHYVFGLEYGK